jgi:hypothetical protein
MRGIAKGVGAATLALGVAIAFMPLMANAANAAVTSSHAASTTSRIVDSTKTPTKCTAKVLGPAMRAVAQGSAYKVNSVACSGDWAYVIFTSSGTKQIDVLEYSSSLAVWIPDNTTQVCSKHLVPKALKTKACSGAISQAQ